MIDSAVFFGLGAIGQRHARLLREIYGEKVKLYAVPSSNNKRQVINYDLTVNSELSPVDELNIELIDYRDISTIAPKLALVCNPTSQHTAYIKRLIIDEINVFCEKPIGASCIEYQELVKILKKKFIFTHIGYNIIFSEAFDVFKSIINIEMKSVISVRVVVQDFLPDWHKYEDYSKSYAANTSLGGGVVGTQSHELHILTNIFGSFHVKYADVKKRSRLKIAAEDNAEIILESVDYNFVANIHLNYHGQDKKRMISISTHTGYIEFDILSQKIRYLRNGENKILTYRNDRNDSFRRQILYLDQTMQENRESINSITRLVDIQNLITDIYAFDAS